MLYSKQPMVKLLAGSTLATFAYNNLANQKDIANEGGLRFQSFVPFLQSPDEYYRCNAAFQVLWNLYFIMHGLEGAYHVECCQVLLTHK